MTIRELIKALKELAEIELDSGLDSEVVVCTNTDEISDWYLTTAEEPSRVVISLLKID